LHRRCVRRRDPAGIAYRFAHDETCVLQTDGFVRKALGVERSADMQITEPDGIVEKRQDPPLRHRQAARRHDNFRVACRRPSQKRARVQGRVRADG
jgi:hypothetical protein